MSITNFPGGGASASTGIPTTKISMPALAEMKRQGKAISALTAYDYATSRIVDEAGIDLILVGDSLAMVVLGYENTLAVRGRGGGAGAARCWWLICPLAAITARWAMALRMPFDL